MITDYIKKRVDNWKSGEENRIEGLAYDLSLSEATDITNQFTGNYNKQSKKENHRQLTSSEIEKIAFMIMNSNGKHYFFKAKIKVLEQRTFKDYVYSLLERRFNGNRDKSQPAN